MNEKLFSFLATRRRPHDCAIKVPAAPAFCNHVMHHVTKRSCHPWEKPSQRVEGDDPLLFLLLQLFTFPLQLLMNKKQPQGNKENTYCQTCHRQ